MTKHISYLKIIFRDELQEEKSSFDLQKLYLQKCICKNVSAKIVPVQILQVTERYGNDYERKNVSDTGSG